MWETPTSNRLPPFVLKRIPLYLALASAALTAEDARPDPVSLERSWTTSLAGGFAETFQMVLGGTYGEGPNLQNKATTGLNDAFRKGDSITVFGISATDMPTWTPNWQAGLLYKVPVMRRKRQALSITGGVQRWVLPMVKTGAKDWVLSGNATYSTLIKRVPVFVSEDSWSLLESTLPKGSVLYSQVYTQHRLYRHEGLEITLRQGPAYTYSWGFYGTEGSRVVRYGLSAAVASKTGVLETGFRKQFGLQHGIPDNNYWFFSYTYQMTKRL